MTSGASSGRVGSGSRSFDFGADDVLCSYDDYEPRGLPNGRRSDPSVKDSHESRTGRSSINVCSQEDYSKDVIYTVENCMKKYADNILRFLEGISGRLSQLEIQCYKIEQSIGEFRTDSARDQREADQKIKSLEKHLKEVHRSVQILRDKQELAETQKELAKLQFVQNELTTPSLQKHHEGGAAPSIPEPKKHDDAVDVPNQHLTLALPHQVPPPTLPAGASQHNQPLKQLALQQSAPATQNIRQDHYILNQAGIFYPHQMQPEFQSLQPRPQMQNPSAHLPPEQPHVISQPQPQSLPQYHQQWPQLTPPQNVQSQPPTSQAQIRPQTLAYPPYPPNQPTTPIPQRFPGGSHYSAIPPFGGIGSEAIAFIYGGPGNSGTKSSQEGPIQRPPQAETNQSLFQPNLNKSGYVAAAPFVQVALQNTQDYNAMYGIDGSRIAHSQKFQPGSYPPGNLPGLPNQQLPPSNSSFHHPGPQLMSSHPYGKMVEKAVSMGYSRDHVLSVIHRMGESGQHADFNALLDRLNARGAEASTRAWSG